MNSLFHHRVQEDQASHDRPARGEHLDVHKHGRAAACWVLQLKGGHVYLYTLESHRSGRSRRTLKAAQLRVTRQLWRTTLKKLQSNTFTSQASGSITTKHINMATLEINHEFHPMFITSDQPEDESLHMEDIKRGQNLIENQLNHHTVM